ncbi:hypothetical protein ANN_26297 [Periplaneta americana]|uniref:HTH psq-type domain-containing protein n=1 Tax=Periplaneta americana TaxID=6978 RepID=A0ABQ8S5W0_PERAM|nr:hypothetical protein ANN_26297 [Periplaneta americana]
MPRKYVSVGKQNCQYSKKDLEDALKDYLDGKLSMKRACEKYHIPKGTLFNRVHGLKGKSYGGPTVFSAGEENIMVNCLLACASWGFPLNTLDVRLFAKGYLDRIGREEKKFVNNMPGVEWAKSFLQRHSEKLSERLANNIKRARANVSEDVIRNIM